MTLFNGETVIPLDLRNDFELWYRDNHPRMVTAMTVMFGDTEIAADAVDEAFVRAYERWERVASMRSPGGWLYAVSMNTARRRLRRRTLERRLLGRLAPTEAIPGPSGELWDLVHDLPPRQRQAVALRHVAQMTEIEIASVMGVQRGTISRTLRSAYDALRIELADNIEARDAYSE